MSAALDQFLAALRVHDCDPQRNGSGWKARCPAHDDQRPSLSLNVGDNGTVLVKCHAGCTTDAVVEAVGLSMQNLFPDKGTATRTKARRIVATYDYRNEDDDLLFQAVRYETKDFRQRRPDGSGGWIWNMSGAHDATSRPRMRGLQPEGPDSPNWRITWG